MTPNAMLMRVFMDLLFAVSVLRVKWTRSSSRRTRAHHNPARGRGPRSFIPLRKQG
jgi:hypothetical protein